jgi:cell division inhibitor SepF
VTRRSAFREVLWREGREVMAVGSLWRRVVGFFGGAEGDDPGHEPMSASADHERPVAELDEASGLGRGPVAGHEPRSPAEPTESERSAPERQRAAASLASPESEAAAVRLVVPKGFGDAQEIADRVRTGVPVIVNMQSCDPQLTRRLLDFCSGLAYALDGSLRPLGEKTFLLTPANLELSSAALARLLRTWERPPQAGTNAGEESP